MVRDSSFKALFIAVGAVALTACGSQTAPKPVVEAISTAQSDSLGIAEAHPSKIIGDNDLVKVKVDGSNLDPALRGTIDAFGLVVIDQSGACTGTHLGNGYVLTAGHCFLSEAVPTPQSVSNADCSTVKVAWGFRGSPATGNAKPLTTLISQCTQIVYAELNPQRDFAIFKVDHAPAAKIAISVDRKRTASNTKLTIFGYPQARPLEWSQYCSLRTHPSLAFAVSNLTTSRFYYQCDTEAGNSGSAVLGVTSSGTVKVVGVHDGAVMSDYNVGTYMYDIRKTLKAKGFDLDQATHANAFTI